MVQTTDREQEWTIDELAAAVGLPVRTIREYQRLELLPPPRREGRVGRYGPEHRSRLAIIGRLQERGYSLAAIGDLMGSWERGRGLGSVLGVDANPAVLDEAPTELAESQLVELVPALAEQGLVEDAVAAGVLYRGEDGFVARSLAVLELIGLAIESGIPSAAAVEIAVGIRAGAASMATAAVDAFVEHAWPRRDEVDVAALLSRARLLMAQAAASLVVHELGAALGHHAAGDRSRELAETVNTVAIGQVRRFATTDVEPT